MKRQLAIVLTAVMLAAAMLVPGAQAGLPTERPVQTEEYVPFVTDFPKPAAAPVPAASSSGIDWGDVGIGSGIAAVLAALLAGSGLVLTRRARPARG